MGKNISLIDVIITCHEENQTLLLAVAKSLSQLVAHGTATTRTHYTAIKIADYIWRIPVKTLWLRILSN